MSEKSNIQHLRDILVGFNKTHGIDTTEANEFLDAAEEKENEAVGASERITKLQLILKEYEDEDYGPAENRGYDNSDFVGLDTIRWSLENGNLVIQQQMEGFIARLQHQNAVTPS